MPLRLSSFHPRRLLCIPAVFWLCLLSLGVSQAKAGMKSPGAYFDESAAALVQAAVDGDAARAAALVKAGANPNAEGRGNKVSLRPLQYAIAVDSESGVRILMRLGADPTLQTDGTGHPLTFPIHLNKPRMLEVLLEEIPRGSVDRKVAADAVDYAVNWSRDPAFLKMLLDRGFPPDLPEDRGLTSLTDVIMRPVPIFEMAEMLVRAGAALNPEPGPAGLNPATGLQFMLGEYRVGTDSHNTLLRIRALMEERGVKFPVPTPAEVQRSRRARQ